MLSQSKSQSLHKKGDPYFYDKYGKDPKVFTTNGDKYNVPRMNYPTKETTMKTTLNEIPKHPMEPTENFTTCEMTGEFTRCVSCETLSPVTKQTMVVTLSEEVVLDIKMGYRQLDWARIWEAKELAANNMLNGRP